MYKMYQPNYRKLMEFPDLKTFFATTDTALSVLQ